MNEDKINEDYLRGLQKGLTEGTGYAHARVMKILLFVQAELEDIARGQK